MNIEWTAPLLWTLPLVALMVATGPWTRRHYRRTTPSVSLSLRRLLILIRSLAVVVLLVAALGPVLVFEREVVEPAVVRVLVEDSRSMAMGDGADGRSRWRTATALAAEVDSVVAGLDGGVVTELIRGNGIAAARPLNVPASPPEADGTSLTRLLRDGGAAGPARITVLLTDGHQTTGNGTAVASNGAVALVGVGDPVGPPDVHVQMPRTPDEAQVGDEIAVEIEVALGGWGDRPVPELTVVLEHEGVEVGRRMLKPAAGDALARCEIVDVPDSAGLRVLTARVLPVAGEALTANNDASAAVVVREGRQRILLLASRPGWMVRFLAVAAAGEERVDVSVVAPTASGPAFAEGGVWTAPATADAWARWDGVIVADAGAGAWLGEGFAAAASEGLGVLFIAATGDRPWSEDLKALWPVSAPGRSELGARRLRVAPDAAGHPVLTGLNDLDASLRLGPPVPMVSVVEAGGGARVVLEARGAEGGDPRPVLVTRRDGSGRTAWLGGADLWEQVFWRPPTGLRAAGPGLEPLLANLLVWLAQGTDEIGATLLGRRHVYHEGEPFEVRARSLELGGRPGAPPTRLEVRRLDGGGDFEDVRLSMRPVPGDERISAVVVGPLPPGRYELAPLGDEAIEAVGPSREIAVTATSLEDRQGRQDRTALRALATSLDATLLDGNSNAGRRSLLRLISDLDLQADRRTVRSTLMPWSTWPFVVLVVLLLGLEWFLRRRHGLL